MYPSRFDYLAPASLEEVVEALGEREGAKVMAGGQSLIPVLKLRIASVDAVVDLNGVPGLDGIDQDGDELRIGALVRHADAERASALTGRYGLLGSTARLVADPLVRNRGTVCGSLAHADPCFREVVAPVCHALQAVVEEDFATAVTQLEDVLPRASKLGGSAAQRDVLEDTLVYALAHAGQGERAARVLDDRLGRRASPLDVRRRDVIRTGRRSGHNV